MNTDSLFYRILTKIGECILISMLWIVFSLPLVTLGASTCALYCCAVKNLRQDRGAILPDFVGSFRENFRQGTFSVLVFAAMVLLLRIVGNAAKLIGVPSRTVYFALLLAGVFLIGWMHYVLSCIARFRSSMGRVLKNGIILCLWNLPATISTAVLFTVVSVLFVLLLPRSLGGILILPGGYALISSFLLEPIYKKHTEEEHNGKSDS